jgi:multidrug resistance efflux pump
MRLRQGKVKNKVPDSRSQKWGKGKKFAWGKFIYILIIIIILGIVAYFFAYERFIYITGRGIVESRQVINIESPFISHIDEIFVDIGDKVNTGDNLVRLSGRDGYEEIISAPFNGSVIDRYKNKDEVTAVKEKILLIANTEDMYILSFFEEKDLKHIKEEEPLKIIFENGDKLNGKITKIYPGILPLPEHYQDLYGVRGSAGKRYIFAEVAPGNGKYDMPVYYNMRLRTAISRWSDIVDNIVDIKNRLIK